MRWLFVGPTGIYLLDFFCSITVESFFTSFLYFDLYVQGLSCKPNIYVSYSVSELRVRLAPWNQFEPSSKTFYWPIQGGTSFVDLLCFFCLVFVMPLSVSIYLCLVVTCWERADILALVCGVLLRVCHFTIGILGKVWYLIVSVPDLCTLTLIKSHVL